MKMNKKHSYLVLLLWGGGITLQVVGLLIIAWLRKTNGTYAEPFLFTALILPAVYMIIMSSFRLALLTAILLLLSSLIFSTLFWDYMDKPWGSPDVTGEVCDGACYGWFSFENPVPTREIIIATIISLALGTGIRFLVFKKHKKTMK